MKRIGFLLVVLVALVWFGTRLVRTEPAVESAQTVVGTHPGKAKRPEAPEAAAPLSAAEKKAQQEKWFGPKTIVAAERAVKNELKDPLSAQFKNVYANYTEKFGVVACGQVNAKNELGGFTGYRRFVSAGRSVILEGRDNISDAWEGACASSR